jgi:hypothetical protein
MPKSIEENRDEKIIENKIEEITEKPLPKETVEESTKVEKTIEESTKDTLALNSIQFTIRRVSEGGLYVIDSNGNGTDIAIPKKYKNKVLNAGDIIYISKSEL